MGCAYDAVDTVHQSRTLSVHAAGFKAGFKKHKLGLTHETDESATCKILKEQSVKGTAVTARPSQQGIFSLFQ